MIFILPIRVQYFSISFDNLEKGENIWDRMTHTHPELIDSKSNGDIACDSYHKYKEDVSLLKNIGVSEFFFLLIR